MVKSRMGCDFMKDRVHITVDADLLKKLEKWAEDEQRTISNLINLLLRKAVEQKEGGIL